MSKISVIIPAYNAEDRIQDTINSVLNQQDMNYSLFLPENLEVIVVNDGSTDNTAEKVSSISDKRLRLFNIKNMGGPGHRANNYGILHSNGDYVVRLDSDDLFLPSYLEQTKTSLDLDDSVDFVHTDYEEFFEDTGEKIIIKTQKNPWNSIAIGVMYRRDSLAKIGIYDPSFIFAEYDLMQRAFQNNFRREHIPSPLFRYIRHSESATSNKELVEEGKKQLFDKWGEFPMRDY